MTVLTDRGFQDDHALDTRLDRERRVLRLDPSNQPRLLDLSSDADRDPRRWRGRRRRRRRFRHSANHATHYTTSDASLDTAWHADIETFVVRERRDSRGLSRGATGVVWCVVGAAFGAVRFGFAIAGGAGGGGAGGVATNAIIVGISGSRSLTNSTGISAISAITAACTAVDSTIGTVGWLGRCCSRPAMRSNMAPSTTPVARDQPPHDTKDVSRDWRRRARREEASAKFPLACENYRAGRQANCRRTAARDNHVDQQGTCSNRAAGVRKQDAARLRSIVRGRVGAVCCPSATVRGVRLDANA
jgi:hypothetical protein